MTNLVELDPWARFRLATRARIGLGRSGDGLPTTALLDFQQAHALARDAVHSAVDFAALAEALAPLRTLKVHSAAADRAIYLRRPDLGRRLDEASRDVLTKGEWDVVFVVADGLSAAAVTDHAVPMLRAAVDRLAGWRVAPVVLAEQARVALGDEVGERIGAALCVLLVGERPGLSVANSLGLYVTWGPRVGRRDSERNCISNVHADGLTYERAADKLHWLMTAAKERRLSGVDLKEEAVALPPASSQPLQAIEKNI
jgi:ethanolamine ammonia-lyase small subunit